MKFIVAWLFLFVISLFASDNHVLRPINKHQSDLYKLTNIIGQYYVDENESQKISSKIKHNIFNWYISHCDHNNSDTIEDLNIRWNSIEQACLEMNKSNQRMVFNLILREYDAAVVDKRFYISKDTFGETGLVLNRKNGKISVIGTLDKTSARTNQIQANTIIQAIDGKLTDNMCLEDTFVMLEGPVNSTVTVTTDKNISYTLTRKKLSVPNVSHIKIENDIAIIKILSFDNDAPKNITKILEYLPLHTNIILDLRNNPGGLVNSVNDSLSLFLQPDTVLFKQISRNEDFNINYASKKTTHFIPNSLFVLINNATSAGALLAAKVLQKENAIIIGNSQETISSIKIIMPLNERDALKLPIAKLYLPDGTVASGTTVKSDIPLDTDSLDDAALYEKITTIIKNR